MTTQNLIDGMAAVIINGIGNDGVYEDEVKQGLSDGDILINLVNVTLDQLLTHLYKCTFTFDVVYFNPSKIKAYDMGGTFLTLLHLVDTDDGMVRGQNMSYRFSQAYDVRDVHMQSVIDVPV